MFGFAFLHQLVLCHAAQEADEAGFILEAHFALGGMDIDIHIGWIQGDMRYKSPVNARRQNQFIDIVEIET